MAFKRFTLTIENLGAGDSWIARREISALLGQASLSIAGGDCDSGKLVDHEGEIRVKWEIETD